MNYKNTRRGKTQEVADQTKNIPELVSGSSTQVVTQVKQPALTMPKPVRQLCLFYNGGFTLIELLVVVLIIGILAAVALPQYQMTIEKARLSEVLVMGKHLTDSQEVHYLTHGDYADNFNDLSIDIPSGYKLVNKNTELENKTGHFSLQKVGNKRTLYYYYSRGKLALALFFWYKMDENYEYHTSITCYAYTTHGQELCKRLSL